MNEVSKQVTRHISGVFRINERSDEEPKTYLGVNIRKWCVTNKNGIEIQCRVMNTQGYMKEVVRIVET